MDIANYKTKYSAFLVFTLSSLLMYVGAQMDIDAVGMSCDEDFYSYNITKPPTEVNGRVVGCYGTVTVRACKGRCDTSEVIVLSRDSNNNYNIYTCMHGLVKSYYCTLSVGVF